MRVRDLGTLAVAVDAHERPVGGVRATAMLALLTINVNQRVPVDALIDAAWGQRVTAGAASTLESHIWRLRQLLEPGRPRRQPPTILVNDAGGYRLIAGAHSVDSLLFDDLAGEVRDLLAAGHAAAAVTRADKALALWRGRPYGPLAEHAWARPAVARLDELHGQVSERRVEALVATSALDQALSDLEPLIAAMPFREPLRAMQMLALYRTGRAEQALHCYQEAHRTFITELGTQPGAELRELHQRILRGDAAPTTGERHPRPAREAIEVHLPAALTPLVGRDDVLPQLRALVAEHRLVTIVGAAGCGKTRVAIEVARAASAAFVDGVWFVDLTAVSDPSLIIDVVISTIGFAVSASATPLENLRNYLRARRMLLVLDNCEHVLPTVARIVEVTLDDADHTVECGILATSREPIGIDGELIWTLDPLRLPGDERFPAAAPAVDLFLQRMHTAAPTLAVDEQVLGRAVEICVALDGLPLPIELAAARARSYTLDDIAAQISADPGRLGRIGRHPSDHRATVRSAIEWSHRMLSPAEQVAHRRLAVLPGPFTKLMAAAVIQDAAVVGDADVDDLLAQLVHRSMLASDGAHRPGGSTLFRQLATVRAHAQHALVDAGENIEITDRRDAWTTALIAARPRLGRAEEADWYHALDDGYATVRATLARHLIDSPDAMGGRLAPRLTYYWYYRARMAEGTRWLRLACDVLRGGELGDALLARMTLASALSVQGRIDLARPHLDHALERLPLVPPDRLVEVGECMIGLITAVWVPAAWMPAAAELVVALHQHLDRVAGHAADADLRLLTDAVGCIATLAAGHPDDAATDAKAVHELAMNAGNITAAWISAGPPMIHALQTARPDDGISWLDRVMQGHMRFGTGGAGSFIESRANFAAQAGDYRQAAKLYAAARTETRRAAMVWPRRQLTHQLLDRTREQLQRADYELAWQEGERLPIAEILQGG